VRALEWDGQALRLAELADPCLQPGDALVRISLAGVCNTDLEIVRGYLDYRGVLGHELVGRVERGTADWQGKRVVAEINMACGHCSYCQRGLGRHCPDRRVLGIAGASGAFAEFVAVPERNLHVVPQSVSDEAAVFVEPLAAAFEILEQVPVGQGTEALVLGDGKLGLLVAMVLSRAGLRVRCVGKHEDHLQILRDCGIGAVLLDRWDRSSASLVVEATGSAAGLDLAIAATEPRGTLVLKSTVADRVTVDLAPLVIHEITLLGSRCGPFEPALAALEDGSIDPTPLIQARVPLERCVEALQQAASPGALKVLIEPAQRGLDHGASST
jgi:threonine dehydrogenase-like Zn-dependent dehydrogenase